MPDIAESKTIQPGADDTAPLSWKDLVAESSVWYARGLAETRRARDAEIASGDVPTMGPLSDEAAAEGTRNAIIQDEGVKGYIRTLPVISEVTSGLSAGMMAFSQQIAQVAGWFGHEPSQQIANEIAQERARMRDERSIMSKDDFMGMEMNLGYFGKVNASDTLAGISEVLPQLLGFKGTGAVLDGARMSPWAAQRLAPLLWGSYMGAVEAEQQAQQSDLEGMEHGRYVLMQGLTEGVLSALMPGGVERIGPMKEMTVRAVLKEGLGESVEENMQGATAALIDWLELPENQDKTLEEATMEWLATVGQTTAIAFGSGALPAAGEVMQEGRAAANEDAQFAEAMNSMAEYAAIAEMDPNSPQALTAEPMEALQMPGAEPVGQAEPLSDMQELPAEEPVAEPAQVEEEAPKPERLQLGQKVEVLHGKHKGKKGTVTLLRPGARAVVELEDGETLGARGGIGEARLRPVVAKEEPRLQRRDRSQKTEEPAPAPVANESDVPGLTTFVSGVQASDMDAVLEAGRAAGTSLGYAPKEQLHRLAEATGKGTRVFIDSGAFQAFSSGKEPDFDQVLGQMEELAEKAGDPSKLTVVAPDVIGDGARTNELQEQHQKRLRAMAAKGVDVVVPMQQHNAPFEEIQRIRRVMGNEDFRIGIPYNKNRPNRKQVEEIAIAAMEMGVDGLHFLGGSDKSRGDRGAVLREIAERFGDTIDITADAARIPAIVKGDRPTTRTIQQRAESQEQGKTEDALHEAYFDAAEDGLEPGSQDQEDFAQGAIEAAKPEIAKNAKRAARKSVVKEVLSGTFKPGQRVQFSRGRRKGQPAEVLEVREDGRLVLRDEKGKVHGKKNGTDPSIVEETGEDSTAEERPALKLDWRIESYELESAKDPADVGQTRWSAKLYNAAHGRGRSGFKSQAEAEAYAAEQESRIEAEKKGERRQKQKEKEKQAAKPTGLLAKALDRLDKMGAKKPWGAVDDLGAFADQSDAHAKAAYDALNERGFWPQSVEDVVKIYQGGPNRYDKSVIKLVPPGWMTVNMWLMNMAQTPAELQMIDDSWVQVVVAARLQIPAGKVTAEAIDFVERHGIEADAKQAKADAWADLGRVLLGFDEPSIEVTAANVAEKVQAPPNIAELAALKDKMKKAFTYDQKARTIDLADIVSYKDESKAKRKKGAIESATEKMVQAISTGQGTRDPIKLRQLDDGRYAVIDGNATFQAAALAGATKLRARIDGVETYDWASKPEDPNQPTAAQRKLLDEKYARPEERYALLQGKAEAVAKAIGGAMVKMGPVKNQDRVVQKANEDYEGHIDMVRDIFRATLLLENGNQVDQVHAAITAQFGEPTRVKDRFAEPTEEHYRDMMFNVNLDGVEVEVQINLPEMIEAKSAAHGLYKQTRQADVDPAVKADLIRQQQEIYDAAWARVQERTAPSQASGETREPSTQARSKSASRQGLSSPESETMSGLSEPLGSTTGMSSSPATKSSASGKSAAETITTSDNNSISEVTPNPTEKPEGSGPSKQALKAAKRLRQAAEKVLAKAEEEQSQERQSNTRRRAEMAASAIGRAMRAESRARTAMKIADALEAGEAQELEQVTVVQDIVAMDEVLTQARHSRMSYSEYERMRHEPFTLEDVEAVTTKHAHSWVHAPRLKNLLEHVKGSKGVGEIRSVIEALPVAGYDGDFNQIDTLEQAKALEQLVKLARAKAGAGMKYDIDDVSDRVRNAKRRIRLGINDGESAKKILAVYVQHQDGVSKEALARQAQIRRDQELRNSDIPGFFPTPRPLVDAMIEKAEIEPGMRVLEPSAGKGDIVQALQEMGAEVEAVEINHTLRGMLEEQGAKLVGNDFLELQLPAPGYGDIYRAGEITGAMHGGQIGSDRVQLRADDGQLLGHYSRGELELVERRGASAGYDRIVMNPPFENGQDREHVQHAYSLLKPGGRLVSIMSSGPFSREQKADQAFRAWFEEVGGEKEANHAGAFAGADAFKQTGVSTVTVVIDKAEDQAPPAELSKQPVAPSEPDPEFMPFADDIPFDSAMRAHAGSSFVPDQRAEQERQGYSNHLVDVQQRLRKAAERYGLGEAEADAQFQEYRRGYRSRVLARLGAQSRTLSPMITGPSKFPTKRNQKRLETSHKRLGEEADYPEWAMRRAVKRLRDQATPEAQERLEVNRLSRKIDGDIEVLAGIESKTGQWRGFDPRAFKNSVATHLRTSIRNGNLAAVEQALAHMEQQQAKLLKRPVLTKRHKVYAELEEAKAKAQQEAAQPADLEARNLATYDGAYVVNDAAADRVRIFMDEKPAEAVRAALRGAGWKWSPKAEAWQRKATANAEASAIKIMDEHFDRSEDDPYKDYSPERVPGQEGMFEEGDNQADNQADRTAKRKEQAFAKRLQHKIDKALRHREDTIRDLHERMNRVRDRETLEDLEGLLRRYEDVDPIALEEDMRKHPTHYLDGPNKNIDPVHVFRKRFTDPPQYSRATVAPIMGGDPETFKLQASLQELEKRLNRAADGAGPTFDVDKGDKGDHGGWYDQQAKRISSKYHNDLDVVSHETGHWLADHYDLLGDGVLDDLMQAELASLGRNATTNRAKMVSEGLGEWAYSYIVNPEHVQRVAPNATRFLLEVIDGRVRKVLEWYSNQVRTFAGLKAVEKFQATMESTAADAKRQASLRHRAMKTVMGWIGLDTNTSEGRKGRVRWWNMGNASWLAKLKFHLTNTASPQQEQYLLALKLAGIDESKLGADVDWRMLRKRMLGMSDRIGHLILEGLEDTHGNLVLDDNGERMHLGWLTAPAQDGRTPEQAATWLDQALAYGAAQRTVELADRLRIELEEEVEAYAQKLRGQDVGEGQEIADRNGSAWTRPDPMVQDKVRRYRKLKEQLLAKRLARLTGAGGGLFSSEEEAHTALRELYSRKDRGQIDEFLRRYRKWASFNLDYAVQTERLSPDQKAAIERSNEYYIDFHRVFAEEDAPTGPDQAIHGSSRTMQNPLTSLIHATWFAVQGGEQNRLMHAFTAPLRQHGGPTALSRIGKTISEESALEAMQKHSGYFDDGSGKSKRVYSMKRVVEEKDPETGRARKVALTEWWVFDPATEASLEASRAMEKPGLVMSFFQMLNNVQRTMITSSPSFALRQFVRDPMENTLNSVVGVKFADAVKAYRNGKIGDRTIDDLFHASGAGMAGWHAKGREAILRQVMGELNRTVHGNRVLGVPATAFRWYKGLLEASEAKARQIVMSAAYDKAIKEGKNLEQARLIASAEARDVIDFAETGYALGQLNRVILFLNAQVQGYVALSRNVRMGIRAMRDGKHDLARHHLGLAGVRMAYFAALAAGIRLLTLATAADDDEEDEYLQQSPWVKDFNFTGKIAGHRVALAKPYEWGWFSGGVERMVDYVWAKHRGKDYDAAKAFDGYSNSFWGMMNPFGKSTFAMSAGPIIEAALNYDTFRGKHIVSPFEEDADLDKRKGTKRASAVSQVLQDAIGVDARKIDFLIRAYGGGWGRMATSESGDRLATATFGATWSRPTWHSRDVEFVLDAARGDRLTNDRRIKLLYKKLYKVYEADSASARDEAAAEARAYATRLRELMERHEGTLPKL